MTIRRALLTLAICTLPLTTFAADLKLATVEKLPEGVPAMIAEQLAPTGYSVASDNGVVCNVWLLKTVAINAGFEPSLAVKYPFSNGQLIGLIQIVQESQYTDFRGQELKPGVFTLRYGLQPEDGNHIGTSEVRDFLLAVPAAQDKSPAVLSDEFAFFNNSAKTAGTAHPAIFALQVNEKPSDKPTLEHQEAGELWILNLTASGLAGEKEVKVPIKLVVVGISEG